MEEKQQRNRTLFETGQTNVVFEQKRTQNR